jgi:hypothetical protein
MSADFEDEEAPPDLIDVAAISAEQAPTDEPPTTRVPITLVTGMIEHAASVQIMKLGSNNWARLSGCRKNDAAELYLDRKTRQENCCDYEWFVYPTPDRYMYIYKIC